ncbi:hypothetical protein FQN50_004785 [Emmonsiellopsis sp. PD_5]|nr:hypothetical protein FQN50_004785 [Emmonsiellopsis sp. PD_5]
MAPPLSKEIISDSESSVESSSDSEPQPKVTSKKSSKKSSSKKPKTKDVKKKPVREPSPSSSSAESEEEESESSDEAESSTPETPSAIPASIPAQEFRAPEGFKLMSKSAQRSSDVSKVFSNLRGKQIWHITAPPSVPINSIQQLALDAVATGESILKHKGVDYRLREDQIGAEKNKALLLPDTQGNTFHRNRLNVAQTFHVERIVDLTNGTTHSEQSVTVEALTKPKRDQPKHLKMRYKPLGCESGEPETFGSSSEESEAEGASRMEVDSDNDQSRLRKSKKSQAANAPPQPKKTKDIEAPRGRKEDQHAEKKGSKRHREETSQERRARREERKRKKQAL